jgi:hypothetical protein
MANRSRRCDLQLAQQGIVVFFGPLLEFNTMLNEARNAAINPLYTHPLSRNGHLLV